MRSFGISQVQVEAEEVFELKLPEDKFLGVEMPDGMRMVNDERVGNGRLILRADRQGKFEIIASFVSGEGVNYHQLYKIQSLVGI